MQPAVIATKPWPVGVILTFCPRTADPTRVPVEEPLAQVCHDCGAAVTVNAGSLRVASSRYPQLPFQFVCVECGSKYERPPELDLIDLRQPAAGQTANHSVHQTTGRTTVRSLP